MSKTPRASAKNVLDSKFFFVLKAIATRVAKNRARALMLIGFAFTRLKAKREVLPKLWRDFKTLLSLLKSWATGEYRELSPKSLVLALAAVLYFVSPVDLIPDIIPGGWIDDIAVLTAVLGVIKLDLTKYRNWQKSRPIETEKVPMNEVVTQGERKSKKT